MTKFKILIFLAVFFLCGCKSTNLVQDNEKINIMTVNFPQFDFAREIAKDNANVNMLLPAGGESHTFEPTPKDIVNIQKSDVFIYTGGESDSWVDDILESVDTKNMVIIKLMDVCNPKLEEIKEGMEHDLEDNHSNDNLEYDEHVWTSPKNAKLIVKEITQKLTEVDEKNSERYIRNQNEYLNKLDEIDTEISKIIESSKRKTIIFGDRFPFLYFVKDYGLDYYAAFPGCSEQTEPNIKTLTYLIDKVKKEEIPVVFYIEFSNHSIADEISMEAGSKSMLFHSCHNVTKSELDDGINYVDIMWKNAKALEEALN